MPTHITSIDFSKGVTIVRLSGSVTLANLAEAQAEFRAKLKGKSVKNILFDLKTVTDTDTIGIAALIDLLRYMHTHQTGDKIGLINIPQEIKDLMAITKIMPLFNEYPSEEEAINGLQ